MILRLGSRALWRGNGLQELRCRVAGAPLSSTFMAPLVNRGTSVNIGPSDIFTRSLSNMRGTSIASNRALASPQSQASSAVNRAVRSRPTGQPGSDGSRPMSSLAAVKETLRHPAVRTFLYVLLFFSLKDVFDKVRASWRQVMYWDEEWDSLWTSDAKPAKGTGSAALPTKGRQLVLIRHGQYANVGSDDDNAQGLTDLGRQQALQTAKRLKELFPERKISSLYISNMKRAQETGRIIAEHLGDQVGAVVTDADLAEGFPIRPSPPSTSTTSLTNQEI
eukprot:Selendium_serpulae@DN6267_c3_g4_i1.p1